MRHLRSLVGDHPGLVKPIENETQQSPEPKNQDADRGCGGVIPNNEGIFGLSP
jgi:hypothetical protein